MSTENLHVENAAREAILQRIRAATYDVPADEHLENASLSRAYRTVSDWPRDRIIDQFAERVTDYRATVRRVVSSDLPDAIAAACVKRRVHRLAVPERVPDRWLPAEIEILRDGPGHTLSNDQLDRCDGVLTGSALGIAQTGTIILDGGPIGGRRALSLLPDYHLCVVFEHQVVGLVPEAIRAVGETVRRTGRPVTLISGPSATSDIELCRVEGVHGPRTLEVLLVQTTEDESP